MTIVRQLMDSVEIDAPSEAIWAWLRDLAEHYTEWHPDHVSAEWERGEPGQVGSVLRAVEDLGREREVLRFEMTSVNAPHGFEYRTRGAISALLPGGAFAVAPHDGGSRFTATISYRGGAFTELVFKHRMTSLRRHMREEGENLKRLIESARFA